MGWWGRMLIVALGAAALAGCDNGAREVDFTPQRAISSDIDASLNHGPTASKPGMSSSEEPQGAFPWDIGQSRQ
jgi:hypothetical protein